MLSKKVAELAALSPYDVLCGRSSESFGHEGNRRFREIVRQHRDMYREATRRSDKNAITRAVIGEIHDIGGRFLRLDARGKRWLTLESDEVYEKVSHALRGSKPPTAAAASSSATATATGIVEEEVVPRTKKPQRAKPKKRAPMRRSMKFQAENPSEAGSSRERQASFNQTLEKQQSIFQLLLQQQQERKEDEEEDGEIVTSQANVTSHSTIPASRAQGKRLNAQHMAGESRASVPDTVQAALDVDPYSCEFDILEGYLSPPRDE
jgi:hypothetical protein